MLKKEILYPIAIFYILILLVGCTFLSFFDTTEFELYSSEIIDDSGFAALSLMVNASDRVTVRLINPLHRIMYSEEIFKGHQKLNIILDSYWTSPMGGSFLCNVRDSNGKKIFENEFYFSQASLSVVSVDQKWFKSDDSNVFLGVSLTVVNSGGLPAYPSLMSITLNQLQFSSPIIPDVIMPYEQKTIHSTFYLQDVNIDSEDMDIFVLDNQDTVLATSTELIDDDSVFSDIVYTWRYKGNSYTVVFPDVSFLYLYYNSLDRIFLQDYALYAFSVFDKPYLTFCTHQLFSLIDSVDEVEIISFIASFVQQLEYALDDPDDPTVEYPRYPVETIKDGQGDCEDMAILTTSFLNILGFDVALIRVPQHMAAGVRLNQNLSVYDYFDDGYYFLETTRLGWQLGQIPENYKDADNFTLFPLTDRPVLYHSWRNATRLTSTDSRDFVSLSIMVENLGSASARDFRISAVFVDDDDEILSKESVSVSFLGVSTKTIVNIRIDVPQDVSSSLKTIVLLDAIQVHERVSQSEFP